MARLSLSKPCTLLPLRRAVTRSPREADRHSSADQADRPPQETSGAGSGRSDRIKGLNILGVYLFRKIQSLQIDGSFGWFGERNRRNTSFARLLSSSIPTSRLSCPAFMRAIQ